jgi:DNA-directed RNA polymerase subunit L
MTQGMMTSPDVAAARQKFIEQGGGTYVGGVRFGLNAEDGPFEAGANMPRQFVGSFNITITQKGDGDAQFVLENATTLKSALYQTPGVQPVERSTMHPLSTKTQTYFWTERGLSKP